MWNLNHSPEREESTTGRPEGLGGPGADDESPVGGHKRSVSAGGGRLFGAPIAGGGEDEEVVTRQFFPVHEAAPQPPATTTAEAVTGVQPLKKSRRGPRSRSSQYRGVTFYRRTGRWESHIW